jgi:hypothetical protein
METKTNYALALVIAVLAMGAYIALPSALAADEPDQSNPATQNTLRVALRYVRHPMLRYILKNGKPADITGIAIVQGGHTLVMKLDNGSSVNVVVPRRWVVGDKILTADDLFETGIFKLGETQLTLKTLYIELKTETHTVDAFFAYTISGNETTANALLPFNIKVP